MPAISIALERPGRFSLPQKLQLARDIHAAAPRPHRRANLAALLFQSDAFAEVAALLDRADDLSVGESMMLVQAWLAIGTTAGNAKAHAAALRAELLAESDGARASALAERGKAELRLGLSGARASLEEALELDPDHQDACKRLVALHLGEGNAPAVLDLVRALEQRGVGHTQLLAARTLALARIGDLDGARASVGMERFLYRATIAPPPGWATIVAFNAALALQLLAHPELRYEGYRTASIHSWRIDAPLSKAPLVGVLLDPIRREIERYLAALAGQDHCWLRAAPAAGSLHCQCVIAEGPGFEAWHLHQSGWLSGVYYVEVPAAIVHGDDAAGCIAWGLPEDMIGAEAANAYGVVTARPTPGMLALFPSHAYHRTFPHGLAERRICVAFDVRPIAPD